MKKRFSFRRIHRAGRLRPLPPVRACPNCGARVDDRYCPRCGQRNAERLASLRTLVRDTLADELSLEAKLPRTLGALLFRPGFLTREYFAGRIARYVLPFRLYLLSSLLFFVVLPLVADFDRLWAWAEREIVASAIDPATGEPGPGRADSSGFVLVRSGIDTAAAPRLLKPLARYYVWQETKLNAMTPREGTRVLYEETTENVPRVIFLLLPVYALFLKALYPRRLYAEHFVFALHFHAFLFLLATATLAAWSLGVLGIGVLQLLFLGILLYLLLALKRAYRQSWLVTAAKYAVILGSYWVVFVFAVTSVVFLVVLTA